MHGLIFRFSSIGTHNPCRILFNETCGNWFFDILLASLNFLLEAIQISCWNLILDHFGPWCSDFCRIYAGCNVSLLCEKVDSLEKTPYLLTLNNKKAPSRTDVCQPKLTIVCLLVLIASSLMILRWRFFPTKKEGKVPTIFPETHQKRQTSYHSWHSSLQRFKMNQVSQSFVVVLGLFDVSRCAKWALHTVWLGSSDSCDMWILHKLLVISGEEVEETYSKDYSSNSGTGKYHWFI